MSRLTPRSRRGPTSKRQARAVGWRIFHHAGLAFCCRSRLSSNVRHHTTKPVASPAGSAARSAESQAATVRHSRVQPASLVHLHGSGQNQTKQCAPVVKQQVNFPSSQVSASRQAAVALGAGFVSQFLEPAAVRSAVASISLAPGGRKVRGRPAWSAWNGLPSFFFTKVSGLSGTLQVFPLLTLCCLTPRSRRGPTAKHQARAAGGRIFHHAGLAFCCRPHLSSNVRHHKIDRAVLQQKVRLAP